MILATKNLLNLFTIILLVIVVFCMAWTILIVRKIALKTWKNGLPLFEDTLKEEELINTLKNING